MADLGSTKVFGDLTVAGDIRIGGASVIDTIKAGDNTAVKLTGNQTVDGVKTFSSTITGSVSGNAATATKLVTARTIAGVSFDGTANISLTAANVGAIATTGGTATGNITAPDFIQSSTQSTNAAACTRKDYVDSAIAAGDALQVSKSGDTMTGNLTAPKVLVSGAQGTEVNALTRKDYVDGQVATRAPTAHTHTVAAITGLRPQDANATANTLVLRDESADVHARLLRTTYVNESVMSGAIAFRVNNSTDNFTRYCSDPTSVRNWLKDAKTDWQMGWRAYVEDANNPMTEYHIPGKTAVITYLTSDGNYRLSTSNGGGGATAERLRIDTGGNLYAAGGVHDMGQRVYSPNYPPPKPTYQFQGERRVGDSIPLTNNAEIVLFEDVRGRMGRSQILDNGMNAQVMMQFPVIDSIFMVAVGNDHVLFELYGNGRRLKRLRGWGEGGPWQGFWIFT